MTLPTTVIEKDHKLTDQFERTADQLMELRWHWTMDEANPNRVSKREYARQVGVNEMTIRADANGWAAWLDENATPGRRTSTLTAQDHRQLARLGAERKEAVEAVARTTGKSVANVAKHQRQVVDAVVNRARTNAEQKAARGKPTTVSDEIEKSAEWQAKAERLAESERKERKATHTAQFIKIESKIGAMLARGREILDIAKDVDFSEDEIEIMTDTLGKLTSLLRMIDLRITGQMPADYDWDTEFQKIAE